MPQRRRFIGAGAAVLATGALIALPAFSSGATTEPQLRSFDSVTPRAITQNPTTEPPLHGTNPHGQGSVAVVDLAPSAERPFSADPTGTTDSEDVVIGRSRGELRADGNYHGHITVAALFGSEIISGADTSPGQSVHTGLAQNLLDGLCTSTGICLSAVRIDSTRRPTARPTASASPARRSAGARVAGAGHRRRGVAGQHQL